MDKRDRMGLRRGQLDGMDKRDRMVSLTEGVQREGAPMERVFGLSYDMCMIHLLCGGCSTSPAVVIFSCFILFLSRITHALTGCV